MVKRVGKYEMGRTLGEGTFGRVKYALNVETGEAVAIKVLDKEKIQKQNMGNQIKKEISIMKLVKHKYIVSLIEVLASKTKIFIVLELVTGGELFDKIVSSGRLKEDEAQFYSYQLIEGVEYCHQSGVCHRDLKPENLLLDANGNLKISDFGLSSLYVGDAEGDGAHRTQLLHTTCGTPNYVAPEVLSEQGYDGKKADVWSIGVILYVLLAGFLPFDEQTISALFNKIKKAEFNYPSWFSPEAKAVIDLMLVADPKSRVSLSQLKENPWIMHGATVRPASIAATQDNLAANNNVSNLMAGDDDDDDDAKEGGASAAPAQKPSEVCNNAFATVLLSGGMLLDKLITPNIVDPSASEGTDGHNRSNSNLTQFGAHRVSYTYRFTSNHTVENLMREFTTILTGMGVEFQTPASRMISSGKARGQVVTAKGSVGIEVNAYLLCSKSTLSLLEIRKGKGDPYQWSLFYSEIINNKCKHLLNIME